jgi:SAM-dependent methyltransferase
VDWRYKALLQSVLSFIPAGDRVNYLFQRHITRNLPVDDAKFREIVGIAQRHLELVGRHGKKPIEDAVFYEFGAGWDLIGPLSFYSQGVDRQILVDIRRLSRPWLVNNTIDRLPALPPDSAPRRRPRQHVATGAAFFDTLDRHYGIQYRAPCDARRTGLQGGSVDYITSTNTLEHVPAADIPPILRECHRLLGSDGVMSFQIDYQDHYSYFDSRISAYNYLQYSQRGWRKYSQSIHHQNRLRHPDYIHMIDDAGFTVLGQELNEGSPADLKTIDRLAVDERFGRYARRELAIRSAFIALRRKPT